ncbi:type IV secretory system conjugative DNA transfer family protein [Nocardia mexicana]|uniref:type IV secretory system conjugative DNA transfer family protein n=1 Tax=Nocardia mexicana TaxID=279262 RepID=UPI001FE9BCCD|nr:TraM recognition domain-containing protein [Nocardia mexicana]
MLIVRAALCGGLALGIVTAALHIGNARAAVRQQIPANPIAAITGLVQGQLKWPQPATTVVIQQVVVVVLALGVLAVIRRVVTRGRHVIDASAKFMGTGTSLRPLTADGARQQAAAAGIRLGVEDPPGIAIGTAVAGRQRLYGAFNNLSVDIWGPGQGKSTCRAIPAILDAVGPVVVTSTKRDVVDTTRGVRDEKGSRTFVFDPEGVAGESPTWYWDPLIWVDAPRWGCETRAARLAGHFADADRYTDARGYAESIAEELLTLLFLAASVDNRPITQVWEWLVNPIRGEPSEALHVAAGGFGMHAGGELHAAASALSAIYGTDFDQLERILGVSRRMVRCLQSPGIHRWLTSDRDSRYRLDESEFIEGNWTLYTLSVPGRSAAAPLVSALLEAVLDTAVRRAQNSPDFILPVPLLAVLDDAANVLTWRDFPQLSSYYGAYGIGLMTMLQSWVQGVRCWGPTGMNELWSAATIKVIGGGTDDVSFLRDRMDGIGSHDVESRGVGLAASGPSYSTSMGTANTLGVSELRSLPRERAVLFAPGVAPVLIKTEPWWTGPYAADVRRSLERHAPRPRHRPSDYLTVPTAMTEVPPPPGADDQPEDIRPL